MENRGDLEREHLRGNSEKTARSSQRAGEDGTPVDLPATSRSLLANYWY